MFVVRLTNRRRGELRRANNNNNGDHNGEQPPPPQTFAMQAEQRLKKALSKVVKSPGMVQILTGNGHKIYKPNEQHHDNNSTAGQRHHPQKQQQQQCTTPVKQCGENSNRDIGLLRSWHGRGGSSSKPKAPVTSSPGTCTTKSGSGGGVCYEGGGSTRTHTLTHRSDEDNTNIARTASYETDDTNPAATAYSANNNHRNHPPRHPHPVVQIITPVARTAAEDPNSDNNGDNDSKCSELSMDDPYFKHHHQMNNNTTTTKSDEEEAEVEDEDASANSVPVVAAAPRNSSSSFVPPRYVYISPTNCWPLEI